MSHQGVHLDSPALRLIRRPVVKPVIFIAGITVRAIAKPVGAGRQANLGDLGPVCYCTAGSAGFRHAHLPDGFPGCVFYPAIVEHTAAIGTRLRLGVLMPTNTERARVLAVTNRSPLLISLLGEAFDRYGVVTTTRTNHVPSGDAGGFARAGITVVNFIESSLWYHSSGDTADRISEQGLERTARAFAHFLDQVDSASLDQILERASD